MYKKKKICIYNKHILDEFTAAFYYGARCGIHRTNDWNRENSSPIDSGISVDQMRCLK